MKQVKKPVQRKQLLPRTLTPTERRTVAGGPEVIVDTGDD